MFLLYTFWRLMNRVDLHLAGATERGRAIWTFERTLGFGVERWLQQRTLPYPWLTQGANGYYAIAHVLVMIALLVWLYFRQRDSYAHWRSVLAFTTAVCVVIRYLPVAPPRLFPGLGFVDAAKLYNQSVYGGLGTGISDQLAAMPSIHVAWAGIVGWSLWQAGTVRRRMIGMAHFLLTIWCVTVTANHWLLDGIVALAVVLAMSYLRHQAFRVRSRRSTVPLPLPT